jgi:hypothetical protein
MKLIPNWSTKKLTCHFCGDTRSVKYEQTIRGPRLGSVDVVPVCNTCVLKGITRQEEGLQRWVK